MWRYWLYRAAMMRDILWALANLVVKAVSSVYGEGQLLALVNVAVWTISSGYCEGHLLALVNVAVWAVSSGYVEGKLVGTGECGVMGFIERLW